jgi:hypothetical protein
VDEDVGTAGLGLNKPKPFCELNHLTTPVGIFFPFKTKMRDDKHAHHVRCTLSMFCIREVGLAHPIRRCRAEPFGRNSMQFT